MPQTKKERLEEIMFGDGYLEDRKNRKKVQKTNELIYKWTVIGGIMFICFILWLPQLVSPESTWLFNNFALYSVFSEKFEIWQPITSMFMHGGIIHLAINMFVLWSFGKQLVKIWGNNKFLYFYIISGLGGSLLFMLLAPLAIPGVGASGAICGLLGAMTLISPNSKVLLFFIIPVKTKPAIFWFGVISAGLLIINLLGVNFLGGIGHSAHLGGLLAGYAIAYYWMKKGNLFTYFI